MSNTNPVDPLLIVTPILLSWTVTYFTGKVQSKKYKAAWFQPPGWVFGIVWTLLYAMLGVLLYESKRYEDYDVLTLIIILMFFTYLWQYFFSYKKWYRFAIYDLLIILTVSLLLYSALVKSSIVNDSSFGEGYLLIYVPFIAWIVFALILSTHTVYTSKKI